MPPGHKTLEHSKSVLKNYWGKIQTNLVYGAAQHILETDFWLFC